MGYDDRREILERLEALEGMVRSRHDERGGRRHEQHRDRRGHDRGRGRDGDNDFDEKRVIDTIVRLVAEHVGRMLDEREESSRGRDEGGGEKRIVDLIVSCVSEHVREIVAEELDRRLGRPKLDRKEDGDSSGPEGEE